MGGLGQLWRPVAALLEETFDILAPDQRGHGASVMHTDDTAAKPNRFHPLDYGQDLIETLEAKAFAPTWCVGHSMGVRSALALAHLQPQLVRGLILVDLGLSGWIGGSLGLKLAHFLKQLPPTFPSKESAKQTLFSLTPDPAIARYLAATLLPVASLPGGVNTPPPSGPQPVFFPFSLPALMATIEAAEGLSLLPWVEAAASAGVPLLFLRGATSSVWSAADYQADQAACRHLPLVQFREVADTGHGLPFEKRAEFCRLILEWTSKQSG